MLSSLPALGPQDAHSLWYPSLATYTFNPPPAHTIVPTQARHHHLSRHGHTNVQPRTMLSTLLADERAVELRKANVRRFGAGWIKPPGLSKTLQGMQDEQAEREEQEAVAEREQAALEAAMAAQQAAEEQRLLELNNGAGEDDESAEGERDLDDDIPEADDGQDGWVDLDGDDGLPRGEGDGDYAEGIEVNDAATGRDLDEDVPEAGSYQHTDTDLDDDSDDSGWGNGRDSVPAMGRISNGSGVITSSVFGSSPLVRAQLDHSATSSRRSGNLANRRHGAEN